MSGFLDKSTGYFWQSTASCDHVVIASRLSRIYNTTDAVDAEHRYPWCLTNPRSLWLATYHGRAELIVQLHALALPLADIWAAGRVFESEKIEDDLLRADQIRASAQRLQWYLELAIFHNDALKRHPTRATRALRRGVAWIIASSRPSLANDEVLKLATGQPDDHHVIEALSLRPLGIESPQNRYPVVGTSFSDLVTG